MGDARLTREERRRLLAVAREAIRTRIEGEGRLRPEPAEGALAEPCGAFVSLHRRGRLRGCIGTFAASGPLVETIAEMAVSAATRDPRFPPVTPAELADLELEISVLSPLRAARAEEVEVGTHGVYVTRGPRRGVLLPQVAVEYRWDRETFLEQTCLKAGLAAEAWRDATTVIEVFTAEVFHEADEHESQS